MGKHNDNQISRKDFLRKASLGLLTFSFFRGASFKLSRSHAAPQQTPPRYRILGRTGIKVTLVGYGASRTMDPTLVKSALDTGINFLDTGRYYYNGQNEVMVGKVIQGMRKEVTIQSKMMIRLRERREIGKSTGISKRINTIMRSSLNESLKALKTDYIDIMLLHTVNSVDIINHETVMEFFREAKEKGHIRACGFSSHNNQLELLKAANESKFYDVIMVPYNHKGSFVHSIYGRYSEWDQPALERELKKAEKNAIGIVAMKTCSGGPYATDAENKPSYKAALKWVLNHSYISTTAVAMGNINELNHNVQAMY